MTNLGLWAPYINEQEMLGWYQLPAEMATEARSYRPDGREMNALSPKAYDALHRKTVAYVRRSVAPFNPVYHNDEAHFAATEVYGLAAADAYAADNRRKMPPLVRQAFAIALRTHDAHHCASTFRIEAPHGMYRPELGTRVSTEWVTALSVNSFMRQEGLPLPARLFQTGVIWSSTYGGATPKGKQLGIPLPQPRTVWGAIMRAADACPRRSIEDQLRQSIGVNYGEVPAAKAPTTMRSFIERERGFMGYIEQMFDRLDHIGGSPLTTQLGWRGRLTTIRRGLDKLETGDRKLVALVHKETRRYGARLG